MGWVKGLEPSTLGTTIRCSNQLSYTHHIGNDVIPIFILLVRQKGFEPLTYCLEGSCSIRLSYWRVFMQMTPFPAGIKMERVMGIEPTRPAWKAGILPLNYTRISHRSTSCLSLGFIQSPKSPAALRMIAFKFYIRHKMTA